MKVKNIALADIYTISNVKLSSPRGFLATYEVRSLYDKTVLVRSHPKKNFVVGIESGVHYPIGISVSPNVGEKHVRKRGEIPELDYETIEEKLERFGYHKKNISKKKLLQLWKEDREK